VFTERDNKHSVRSTTCLGEVHNALEISGVTSDIQIPHRTEYISGASDIPLGCHTDHHTGYPMLNDRNGSFQLLAGMDTHRTCSMGALESSVSMQNLCTPFNG
jgi:hypothetical protein